MACATQKLFPIVIQDLAFNLLIIWLVLFAHFRLNLHFFGGPLSARSSEIEVFWDCKFDCWLFQNEFFAGRLRCGWEVGRLIVCFVWLLRHSWVFASLANVESGSRRVSQQRFQRICWTVVFLKSLWYYLHDGLSLSRDSCNRWAVRDVQSWLRIARYQRWSSGLRPWRSVQKFLTVDF